jgi:signal transduction histidine kinase
MMHLSFQDLQKVLRWESMEQEFQQQLHVQKMLAIKNLAYGASHEINNPLANISTRAQALLLDETDSERQRSLGTISDQAFRANAMIADLMLFAHPPTMDLKPLQLAALLQRCLVEMQAKLDSAEIQVQCNGSDDVLVMGDRVALFEMFKALLQNCIDAIQGGTITISWETSLGQVQIMVDDDGPGVRDEIMPFIFDPFFSGREAGRGLGFGLSKAWRIMQIHHGSIEIENRQPTGIRVTICIPQAANGAATTG